MRLVIALVGALFAILSIVPAVLATDFRVESVCLVNPTTIRIEVRIPRPGTVDFSWERDFDPTFATRTYAAAGRYTIDAQPPDFTDHGTEWVYARLRGTDLWDKGYIDDREPPCRSKPTPTPTPTSTPTPTPTAEPTGTPTPTPSTTPLPEPTPSPTTRPSPTPTSTTNPTPPSDASDKGDIRPPDTSTEPTEQVPVDERLTLSQMVILFGLFGIAACVAAAVIERGQRR